MEDYIFGIKLKVSQLLGGQSVTYIPLNHEDLYEVVEEIMGMHPKDMDAVQMQTPDPKRIDVTMCSLDAWKKNNIDAQIGQ